MTPEAKIEKLPPIYAILTR
jgi:hypothetical protein